MRHTAAFAGLAGLATLLLTACGQGGTPESGDAPAAGSAPGGEVRESAGGAADGADLDALLAEADPARGRTLFLQCRACHSLAEGEPHKVGPNLHGMFGRKAGMAPGFGYSEVLADADIVWTAETVNEWLARPSDFLPGNNMVFIGVDDARNRAHLIAYLREATGAE